MKRALFFTIIALLLIGGIVVSEVRKPDVPVGPAAILYFIADTEREVTRMPMQMTRMSDTDEIRIGNEMAKNYERYFQQSRLDPDDQIILNYVRDVGSRLAQGAHRKLPYQFHYIPNRHFVNAFALPGGHIFFGAGMLEFMDSEDELASVLAHELEHVDHYHCAERVQAEMTLRKLPLGELVALPAEIFEAGYSKQQEAEADREGVLLMHARGYSPAGAIRLFEVFDRFYRHSQTPDSNPQEEIARVTLEGLSGYFRSHPSPEERIAQVRQVIAEQNWVVRQSERDLQVRYIVIGNHAKDALVENKYGPAVQMAKNALALNPNYVNALRTLAEAEFALADFSASADAYHKLLAHAPSDLDLGRKYAVALSGSHEPASAAREYESWLEQNPLALPRLKLELAGLKLLAGNNAPAEAALRDLNSGPPEDADEGLFRLGYWYYRAGNYTKAADLLTMCAEHRPGDREVQRQLAWSLIEQNRLETALQRLNELYPGTLPETIMEKAIASWRAQDKDVALADFGRATASAPYWNNARWTSALYSPLVTRSIAEMSAAAEQRRQAIKAVASR